MENKRYSVDKSWTLFLDRDGVINRKRDNDYVKTIEEMEVLDGALEAIKSFSNQFGRVIIITNQRGVSRGIMTSEDVNRVHEYLLDEVNRSGGRIDAVYFCPEGNGHPNRKPAPGMGHLAKADFPEIDFNKTIMVGDSVSDMEFGRNVGTKCFFLNTIDIDARLIDGRIQSLQDLLSYLD